MLRALGRQAVILPVSESGLCEGAPRPPCWVTARKGLAGKGGRTLPLLSEHLGPAPSRRDAAGLPETIFPLGPCHWKAGSISSEFRSFWVTHSTCGLFWWIITYTFTERQRYSPGGGLRFPIRRPESRSPKPCLVTALP